MATKHRADITAAFARPHGLIPGGWTLWIPGLRLESEANAHTIWQVRHARVERQHKVVNTVLGLARRPPLPLRVVITRVCPTPLDSDNTTSSGKHVRDAVAKWIGINDRSPEVEWIVLQERLGNVVGARIEIVPMPAFDGRAVGARVTLGALVQVESVLSAADLASLARYAGNLAAGRGTHLTATIGGMRLTLRRAEGEAR